MWAGVAVVALAEGDFHAVSPLQPSTTVQVASRGILELEAWKYGYAHITAPFNHLPDLVCAHLVSVLDHAHDPPVDEVFPHFLFLAYHAPDLGLVKEDVAVAETEGQHVHAGAHELVDGPPQLVPVHGRIEPFGVVVVRVAVVDEAGRSYS